MNGRKLEVSAAKAILKRKGCKEKVLSLDPPRAAMIVPIKAQRRMGIKSWGLIDFLRQMKISVLLER